MQKALQAVIVVMATFSECYDEPSQVMQLASSVLNSGKYVFDQELRARQASSRCSLSLKLQTKIMA